MTLALAGCATTPAGPSAADPLLADALFAPSVRVDETELFAVSDAMRQYIRQAIQPAVRRRGSVGALTDALYTRGHLALEYDSAVTRTASQAFDARAGNCLSLVIMTAALAREIELDVQYQLVAAEETWERSGDLYFFSGHVNLSIGPRPISTTAAVRTTVGEDWVTIDFLPEVDLRGRRTRLLSEGRIVAMFMNNRAAEAMAAGRLDDAYAWARAAVLKDRRYWAAYNTLGVIYQRRGAYAQAETVFRTALAAEPQNVHVMANLVLALQHQGRAEEAAVLAAELKRLQPVPPFALFREGKQALLAGDYQRAAALFERELDRSSNYHEFHYWLAVALLNMGDTRAATAHLELALKNSTTRTAAEIYAAKLQKVAAARAPR